jgi:hypothetical protein
MEITDVINQTIREFQEDPYHINCGLCEEFAMKVLDKMGIKSGDSEETYELGTNNLEPEFADFLPGHVWIVHKGKCYDAECSEGVDTFLLLPIFKNIRYMKKEGWKRMSKI